MNVISNVAGFGEHASLKQLLASLPREVGSFDLSDPVEFAIPKGLAYQASLMGVDETPKGGHFGARKFRRRLENLVRSEPGVLIKGDTLPTPIHQLSKTERQNRLGYAPAPRQRSSTARGRKAAMMEVMRLKRLSRRIPIYAAVGSCSSQH